MRVEGRGKTVEETLALHDIPFCLRQEKGLHKAGYLSRLTASEGMGGEVSNTSSNLMYPGNPQFNRLYHLAHIRFNVPEDSRIKVKTEQQIADVLHFNRGGIQ